MSSSLDLALCVYALGRDDDYSRLFRQVHRILNQKLVLFFVRSIQPLQSLTAKTQQRNDNMDQDLLPLANS